MAENGAHRKGGWVGRTLFESALIVIGIILGFIANEWREDLQLRSKADDALDRIIQELELNREAVARILPYHERVASELRALLAAPPQKPFVNTFLEDVATQGIGDLVLLDTAWQTASSRDSLSPFDFYAVQQLADIYGMAEGGANFTQLKIIEFFADAGMYAPDSDGVYLQRQVFAYETLVLQERALLERYDYILATLKEADQ